MGIRVHSLCLGTAEPAKPFGLNALAAACLLGQAAGCKRNLGCLLAMAPRHDDAPAPSRSNCPEAFFRRSTRR